MLLLDDEGSVKLEWQRRDGGEEEEDENEGNGLQNLILALGWFLTDEEVEAHLELCSVS